MRFEGQRSVYMETRTLRNGKLITRMLALTLACPILPCGLGREVWNVM